MNVLLGSKNLLNLIDYSNKSYLGPWFYCIRASNNKNLSQDKTLGIISFLFPWTFPFSINIFLLHSLDRIKTFYFNHSPVVDKLNLQTKYNKKTRKMRKKKEKSNFESDNSGKRYKKLSSNFEIEMPIKFSIESILYNIFG